MITIRKKLSCPQISPGCWYVLMVKLSFSNKNRTFSVHQPPSISDEFQLQLELKKTVIWLVVTIKSIIPSLDRFTGDYNGGGGGWINRRDPKNHFIKATIAPSFFIRTLPTNRGSSVLKYPTKWDSRSSYVLKFSTIWGSMCSQFLAIGSFSQRVIEFCKRIKYDWRSVHVSLYMQSMDVSVYI